MERRWHAGWSGRWPITGGIRLPAAIGAKYIIPALLLGFALVRMSLS